MILGLLKRFWPELLAIVVIAAAVFAFHKFTESVEAKGHARGVLETTAEYVNRDNVALKEAIAAQRQAQLNAIAAEARATAANVLASTNYQKGVNDAKKETARLVAAANAGALRLRDPGKAPDCPSVGDNASQTQTAATASGSHGQAGAELSTAASQFLLELTGEADQLARRLTLAQDVITSDRALCNSP